MRIGDLNKRIEIQAPTRVSDGMGGFTTTYTTLYTVDAAIWDATSNELNQASATTLIITHRIRIRYKSGFRASYRIKFAGKYFNIVSIVDVNMNHRTLDLLCKEAAG